MGLSRPLTHPQPNVPVPPWNSLWQLSQVRPFWNPAPFMPGFEPTEMIWLGFGLVLTGEGVGRKGKNSRKRIHYFCLLSMIMCPAPCPSLITEESPGWGKRRKTRQALHPSHLLGGDVDLFQFAVCFSSFQSLLQKEREGSEHLSREMSSTSKAAVHRSPLVQPPQPRLYLLNVAVCGFPHVIKLDYAGK